MDKKNILVLGARMVVKPAVDYFLDKCHYHVTIATRTVSKAHAIIGDRANATVIQWDATDFEKLDKLVPEADLVVNFIPPAYQVESTRICIKHQKHMIHTDFTMPEVAAMDKEAKKAIVACIRKRKAAWINSMNFNETGMATRIPSGGLDQDTTEEDMQSDDLQERSGMKSRIPSDGLKDDVEEGQSEANKKASVKRGVPK